MAVDQSTPPSVRIIRAVTRAVVDRPRRTFVILTVAAVAMTIWSGIFTVDSDETATVLAFGKVRSEALSPGLHFRVPLVERVHKAGTGEALRMPVEGDFTTSLPLVSADENLVDASIVVQYRISDLSHYLFSTENPQLLVQQAVRSGLVDAFAQHTVDDALTSAKTAIQNRARQLAQGQLDMYSAGVQLTGVNLQSVTPPPEASGAFRAVSDAVAEAAQTVSRAQADREKVLRVARGESEALLSQARSFAESRRQAAQGSAQRFEQLRARYVASPRQTKTELYYDTVRSVLPRTNLVVLAPGETPNIDVNLVRSGKGAKEDSPRRVPPRDLGDR